MFLHQGRHVQVGEKESIEPEINHLRFVHHDHDCNFSLGKIKEIMATQEIIPGSEEFEKPQDELALTSTSRIMEWAVRNGATPEQLATLLDVKLRLEADEKKKAYDRAMSAFRKNAPVIDKTKTVTYANKDGSETTYKHPELDKAAKIVGDALLAVGIRHSWKMSEGANGRTIVTCVLTHDLGHAEDVSTLGGPPDASGGKNSVQAIGSTATYLQRYTLLAGCGLVPKGVDDDGRSGEAMDENAITDYCIQMKDAANLNELQTYFGEGWSKAKAKSDKSAQDRIRKVYEEKKKALRAGSQQ